MSRVDRNAIGFAIGAIGMAGCVGIALIERAVRWLAPYVFVATAVWLPVIVAMLQTPTP